MATERTTTVNTGGSRFKRRIIAEAGIEIGPQDPSTGENNIFGGASDNSIAPFTGAAPRWCVILGGESNTIGPASRRSILAGGLGNQIYNGDNNSIISGSNHEIGASVFPPNNPNCDNNVILCGNQVDVQHSAVSNTVASGQFTTLQQASGCVALATVNSDILGPLGGPNAQCNLIAGREAHITSQNGTTILTDFNAARVETATQDNECIISFTNDIQIKTAANTTIEGATFRGGIISSPTGLSITDSGTTYEVDKTGGPFTITLPAPIPGLVFDFVVTTAAANLVDVLIAGAHGTIGDPAAVRQLNNDGGINMTATSAVGDNITVKGISNTKYLVQAHSSVTNAFTVIP